MWTKVCLLNKHTLSHFHQNEYYFFANWQVGKRSDYILKYVYIIVYPKLSGFHLMIVPTRGVPTCINIKFWYKILLRVPKIVSLCNIQVHNEQIFWARTYYFIVFISVINGKWTLVVIKIFLFRVKVHLNNIVEIQFLFAIFV